MSPREAFQVGNAGGLCLLAAHQQDNGKGAGSHEDIARHIDHHAGRARQGAGGKACRRISHMRNRGIGHHPLDVGLHDGAKRANHH